MREILNNSVSIGFIFVVLVGCAILLVLLLKDKLKIQNNIKRFILFFLLFYFILTKIVFSVMSLISGRIA